MKLYYDLMSQPSRALYIFLVQAKIPFVRCPVALRKGEHKTEEYGKIHPFHQVPAIDDDGFKLTESVAILRYFATKYQGQIDDSWYPKEPKKRARVDEYMEWQHGNVRFNCAMFFQHKFLIPLLSGSPPDEKKIDRFRDRMEDALDALEEVWLARAQFMAGEKPSFADLLAVCELQQPGIVGYDVTGGRPRLAAWMERAKSSFEPGLREASEMVEKFTGRYARGELPIPSSKL